MHLHDVGKPVVAKPMIHEGKVVKHKSGKPYNTFRNHHIKGEEIIRGMPETLLYRRENSPAFSPIFMGITTPMAQKYSKFN